MQIQTHALSDLFSVDLHPSPEQTDLLNAWCKAHVYAAWDAADGVWEFQTLRDAEDFLRYSQTL